MQIPDATKETPDFNNLQALMNQDVGDYYRHSFLKNRQNLHSGAKYLVWVKNCRHFWLDQNLEKESWFSVGGFGMETSNFAPNGCPRVSTTQKFYARSDGGLRMIPCAL